MLILPPEESKREYDILVRSADASGDSMPRTKGRVRKDNDFIFQGHSKHRKFQLHATAQNISDKVRNINKQIQDCGASVTELKGRRKVLCARARIEVCHAEVTTWRILNGLWSL